MTPFSFLKDRTLLLCTVAILAVSAGSFALRSPSDSSAQTPAVNEVVPVQAQTANPQDMRV